MSNGKQIQHLYHRNLSCDIIYDRTEVIDVFNVDYALDIIHLLIHPEEVIVREEAQEATRYGVLPDWFALQ